MKHLFFPVVVIMLVTSLANAADEKLNLEHFKCYEVLETDADHASSATLLDQFHVNDPQRVKVGPSVAFCNPTTKYHAPNLYPIENRDHHLTVYPIYPHTGRPLKVRISNQFGKQTLNVYQSVALMVPTHKASIDGKETGHLQPKGLDHFQCYRARGKRAKDRVVLSDQFFEKTLHEIWEPFLFCNPVEKRRLLSDNGETFQEVTEISNPRGHLTCYRTHQEETPDIKVGIIDQFERNTLALKDTISLCVPTHKIKWSPIIFKPKPLPVPVEDF